MDGLHRLKSGAVYVSLFLQVTAVYLLIHISGLQNSSTEQWTIFHWQLMTCQLLSIICMMPFLIRQKAESNHSPNGLALRSGLETSNPLMDGVYKNLKKGLNELESHLKGQSVESADFNILHDVSENIKILQERNKSIYDCLLSSHEEIQKANSRLQRIMEQNREYSTISAQTRMDWKKTNKPIDSISHMRQNLDNLLDRSKNLTSLNASTLRLIGESLQSDSILHDKIGRAQEHLERIHYSAHSGSKVHESIASIVGETRDNISGANTFVLSLCQKWDSMVNLTEQIDEIANQINAQSLAASMEMVRTSNSQTVTDLFPFGTELRGLAAQFHTFAHVIKDVIQDVRDEIHKTQQYLSQATSKSDHAYVAVNQCGEYLRNSVAAVKYSSSELVLLQQEVNIHMNKLQESYNMGVNTADLIGSMDRFLLNHSTLSKKVLEETSQKSQHSEKISTLLTKQVHELNHCQKILAKSAPLLTESMRFSTEIKQTIATMEMGMEKASPKKPADSYMAVEQNRLGEVQVTCWKISSS